MMDGRLGWFDSSEQSDPAYDPGLGVSCPVCGETLVGDVVANSLMWSGATDRSYFYRLHRACRDGLAQIEADAIDGVFLDSMEQPPYYRNPN